MHAVVAHLQRGDAGALALPDLELSEPAGGVLAQAPELVEIVVVAGCDDAAVADGGRRRLDDRALEEREGLAEVRQARCQRGESRRIGQRLPQAGKLLERRAQPGQISRCGAAQRQPRHHALQVPDFFQGLAQGPRLRMLEQGGGGRVPGLGFLTMPAGCIQPALEQAPAHGGAGRVHEGKQRRVFRAVEASVDLQIAPRVCIQADDVVITEHDQGANVLERLLLRVAGILEHGGSGADAR